MPRKLKGFEYFKNVRTNAMIKAEKDSMAIVSLLGNEDVVRVKPNGRRTPTFFIHHAESETLLLADGFSEAERYTMDGCDIIPRRNWIEWWWHYEIPF